MSRKKKVKLRGHGRCLHIEGKIFYHEEYGIHSHG